MNPDKIKIVEVEGRKFQIVKFDARTSLKISKLLLAKVLPALDTFLPLLSSGLSLNGDAGNEAWADDVLSSLSLEKIAAALDLIEDNELDKLLNFSLSHCYEVLRAGPIQVLNPNGTYGVGDVEDDLMLMLRLTAEAILWSLSRFFNASRWTSMFKPLAASFSQNPLTSTTSFSPPLSPGIGGNMNAGTEPTQ